MLPSPECVACMQSLVAEISVRRQFALKKQLSLGMALLRVEQGEFRSKRGRPCGQDSAWSGRAQRPAGQALGARAPGGHMGCVNGPAAPFSRADPLGGGRRPQLPLTQPTGLPRLQPTWPSNPMRGHLGGPKRRPSPHPRTSDMATCGAMLFQTRLGWRSTGAGSSDAIRLGPWENMSHPDRTASELRSHRPRGSQGGQQHQRPELLLDVTPPTQPAPSPTRDFRPPEAKVGCRKLAGVLALPRSGGGGAGLAPCPSLPAPL